MTTNIKSPSKLNNWELLIIFIGFISIVCLIISVYAAQIKEKFYPWAGPVYGGPWGGPASGGPWNIPTRWPIRGWGWDIRGYPAPYPIDYGYYGYPGGQPAYPAPQPDGSNSNTSLGASNGQSTKSGNAAPFGIEMTPTTTTKPANSSKTANNKPSTTTPAKSVANNQAAQDEKAAAEFYAEESKWWPNWVSWPWYPYFNYGLHYDVNGKLKKSNNESIPANHAWPVWW
jgi:hypothetical protein